MCRSLVQWIIDNVFVSECYHSQSHVPNRVARIILVLFSMQLKITMMSVQLNNMAVNITVSISRMVSAVVCVTMVTLLHQMADSVKVRKILSTG